MRKQLFTPIAVAILVLSAGAVLASGEELDQNDPLTGGDSSSNATDVDFVDFKYWCDQNENGAMDPGEMCASPGEAQQAGFLRELRIRRQLLIRRITPFYCSAGPAIRAALRLYYSAIHDLKVDLSVIECPVDEE